LSRKAWSGDSPFNEELVDGHTSRRIPSVPCTRNRRGMEVFLGAIYLSKPSGKTGKDNDL